MEIGTLEHDILRCLISTTTLSTEDSGNAHGIFGIADAQVVFTQDMILTVESHEMSTFGLRTHYDAVSLHHVGIEAVHWLSVGQHDIIGNVHDVIDRTKPHDAQFFLHPFRTFLHVAIGNAHAGIALAGLCVFNIHIDRQVFIVNDKLAAVRTMKTGLVSVLLQPCIQVSGNAVMTQRICTIGRQVNLYHPIALQVVVFCSGLTDFGILRKYDDAIVACAHANLILSANHSV